MEKLFILRALAYTIFWKGSGQVDSVFLMTKQYPFSCLVTVWSTPSDASMDGLIVSTIVSGHLEAFYGGKEGSEEKVLV